MLAEQDAAEPDERKRVVGAEPTGRLQRGFRSRVERRVGRLADPLQQREAELELRLTVVGVLGDASGEELDEALGWRCRRRRLSEAASGWARASGWRAGGGELRGAVGSTAAVEGAAPAQAAMSNAPTSTAARRLDQGTENTRRPRHHGHGYGRPLAAG